MKTVDFDLNAFWMPFTANRQYKAAPRVFTSAKDMYYTTHDGRKVLDGSAALWCVNAGHCRDRITEAIHSQAATLDFAPTFQMGHPGPFKVAQRLAALAPGDLERVFFTNSGSESVDTALKIALAYHRARGEPQRTVFVGRERGYHGVGFGGISVGGIPPNRKVFSGGLLPRVDHLPHTHVPEKNAFTRGQPEWGAHLADDLERRIIPLQDASNIAAVIVEPVAGSTGVLVPPRGYLERLREICDKHGILLIFDEVITGFGRLGKPFAAEYFNVIPDMITCAKGLTNGTVPMGAVICKRAIYDAFMEGPEHVIELFHGYTYSGHPLACAAALATLDIYEEEGLLQRAGTIATEWEESIHSLKALPHVVDIRNIGLVAAIELEPRKGGPGLRGYEALIGCFERGLLTRVTGDVIALSPPLIISSAQIGEMATIIGDVLRRLP